MSNSSRVIKLTQTLVSTNSESPPGQEREVANLLREHLEQYGISCTSVGPNDRPNLIFSTNEDTLGPVVFHGHMDTVPVGDLERWSHDPFLGEIHDGKLYGRGACDMKGPLAALTEAMIQYNDKKNDTPFVLLCTSDEESGCSGAEAVADSGILSGVKYGVCAEPTDLHVLVGEKGMLWTKVIAHGKAAHGSRPSEGVNAIQLCSKAIEALSSHDYPYELNDLMGMMSLNVGMIKGGIKINVVPDYCEASLDMRTVKGQSTERMLNEMKHVLRIAGLDESVSIQYIHGKPAVVTPEDATIVTVTTNVVESVVGKKHPLSAATYGTDCSVLQPRIGILNVICGPGSIEQAHQPDEYIQVSQLMESVEIYLRIADKISEVESS
ncbi:MAG: M20 family metallopeptidase [Candidatus Thorarchaeota archaeon]